MALIALIAYAMMVLVSGNLMVDLGIQFDDEQSRAVLDESQIRQIVEHVLTGSGIASPLELGLVITNDEAMRDLNRRYRNVNATTDVLSFALHEEQSGQGETPSFVVPPDGILHLGEVIISYPQAWRQAEKYRHSVKEEVELLIIHGVLHLIGYRDDEPEAEQNMRAVEKRVMSEVNGI